MALTPGALLGGQLAPGVAPEHIRVEELRQLCSCVLEMTCTLLCQFCQATRSSLLALAAGGGAAADRSVPAASVLNGLLSFLHELRSSAANGSLGIEIDYLMELDNTLRSWQQLGLTPETERERQQHQGCSDIDGEAWTSLVAG